MARLTRILLIFAAIIGSATVAPTTTQASCRACRSTYYAPMGGYTASYVPYNYTTAYAPLGYSTGYAPNNWSSGYYGNYQQSAYYGSTAYYGASCCNNCSGCSTCSSCNSCSSGNCGVGCSGCSSCGSGGCSNCSVNSAPSSGPTPSGYGSNSSGYGSSTSGYGSNTSGYGSNNNVGAPVPDPYNSRDINARINELEHRLNEDEKFLRKQHKDTYQPDPYNNRPSTYRDGGETVPARRRNTTIDSNLADPDNFAQPIRGRNSPAPSIDLQEEERRKPELAAPTPLIDKTSGKDNDGAVNFREDEPQTLRLEDRAVTQAVAPRQRMQIVTKQSKTVIAKSNKPVKTSSGNTVTADLARN